jgi:hypothetical protein
MPAEEDVVLNHRLQVSLLPPKCGEMLGRLTEPWRAAGKYRELLPNLAIDENRTPCRKSAWWLRLEESYAVLPESSSKRSHTMRKW